MPEWNVLKNVFAWMLSSFGCFIRLRTRTDTDAPVMVTKSFKLMTLLDNHVLFECWCFQSLWSCHNPAAEQKAVEPTLLVWTTHACCFTASVLTHTKLFAQSDTFVCPPAHWRERFFSRCTVFYHFVFWWMTIKMVHSVVPAVPTKQQSCLVLNAVFVSSVVMIEAPHHHQMDITIRDRNFLIICVFSKDNLWQNHVFFGTNLVDKFFKLNSVWQETCPLLQPKSRSCGTSCKHFVQWFFSCCTYENAKIAWTQHFSVWFTKVSSMHFCETKELQPCHKKKEWAQARPSAKLTSGRKMERLNATCAQTTVLWSEQVPNQCCNSFDPPDQQQCKQDVVWLRNCHHNEQTSEKNLACAFCWPACLSKKMKRDLTKPATSFDSLTAKIQIEFLRPDAIFFQNATWLLQQKIQLQPSQCSTKSKQCRCKIF